MTLPAIVPTTLPMARLVELEAVIERGVQTFVEVGEALLEIRESRLYRDRFATFEDYCRKRWGWTHQRSSQLIDAASVVRALPETATTVANERQARELVSLLPRGPEVVREVWGQVVERAERDETPITGPIIRTAVREHIRGLAAQSEAELQAAAASWTDAQREAFSPEMSRQRGELMRLIRDLGALPEPIAFAKLHKAHLPPDFVADAAFTCGWLEFFCDALEGRK